MVLIKKSRVHPLEIMHIVSERRSFTNVSSQFCSSPYKTMIIGSTSLIPISVSWCFFTFAAGARMVYLLLFVQRFLNSKSFKKIKKGIYNPLEFFNSKTIKMLMKSKLFSYCSKYSSIQIVHKYNVYNWKDTRIFFGGCDW